MSLPTKGMLGGGGMSLATKGVLSTVGEGVWQLVLDLYVTITRSISLDTER